MRRLLTATVAACAALPAVADNYGNENGCLRLNVETINGEDDALLVRPDRTEYSEGYCTLPATVDYTGGSMTVHCWGEGDEWTEEISLKKDGETLIYNDRIVLSRCEN